MPRGVCAQATIARVPRLVPGSGGCCGESARLYSREPTTAPVLLRVCVCVCVCVRAPLH